MKWSMAMFLAVAVCADGPDLRHKLGQMVVPEINFRAAKPADVIEFLQKMSKTLSPDKTEVNFVWQVPADTKLPPVTLNVKNVPFLDVLNYVTELTKLKYRIDTYAVIVYLPPAEKPNAVAQ